MDNERLRKIAEEYRTKHDRKKSWMARQIGMSVGGYGDFVNGKRGLSDNYALPLLNLINNGGETMLHKKEETPELRLPGPDSTLMDEIIIAVDNLLVFVADKEIVASHKIPVIFSNLSLVSLLLKNAHTHD